MKACFFGLGSIGTRHCLNLTEICHEEKIPLEIHAVRSSDRPLRPELAEMDIRCLQKWEEMDSQYDMVFVTNPTSLHYETLTHIGDRSNRLFIEKPVFDRAEPEIGQLPLRKDCVSYVAAPLRYTRVIREAREFVKEHRVYCARAISSSYLPDWRPGQDYRETYSAKRTLGGGVSIDLIHEWDYLSVLFGIPETVKCIIGRYSELEIDSDDLAIYIARYPELAVEVHLDYFGKPATRVLQLFTKEGCTCFDIAHNCIFTPDGQRIQYEEKPNDKYLQEMYYFLSLVRDPAAKSENSIEYACKVLKTAKGESL